MLFQSLSLRHGVAFGTVHAAPHVRVQAEKMVAHQHLNVLRRRRLAAHKREIAGHGHGHGLDHRAVVQVYLQVQCRGALMVLLG